LFFEQSYQWPSPHILRATLANPHANVAPDSQCQWLEQIGFSTLPGNRVQVYLAFSQDAPMPISFSPENPARISLDFPNVRLGLRDRSKDIGIGVVQGANAR
jgi:hypothetical protein